MLHKIRRLADPPKVDCAWDESPWQDIASASINSYMGKEPEHQPGTEVKVAYDDATIYVIFRVEDRYVRAVAGHQGNVCQDSCVEFFFTPGPDVSIGYFNLEMNCGGTMLFHFQKAPGDTRNEIPLSECDKIVVAHSLPRIVDPEIEEPVTWTVAYGMPISVLQDYCDVVMPAPGVTWRANFYKCADRTSHPHWLTWAPVDFPVQNFHLPHDFGVLEFQ